MMLARCALEGRMYRRGEPSLVGTVASWGSSWPKRLRCLPLDVFRPEAHQVAPHRGGVLSRPGTHQAQRVRAPE